MSEILLRGLEFPKDGYIIVRIYANGEVCEPTECAGVWGKAATAVQLPSHGRLIDADVAKSKMHTGPKEDDYCDYLWSEVDEVYKKLVDKTETVIPANGDAM